MSNGTAGGRPSILQRLSASLGKTEHEILVDWYTMIVEKEAGAKGRIAKKYSVDQVSVWRVLSKLTAEERETLRAEAIQFADHVPTQFWSRREDGKLYSDYPEIDGFIQSKWKAKSTTIAHYLSCLKAFWLRSNRRNPKNWNDTGLVDRVFSQLKSEIIYKCPECGREYPSAGNCRRDQATLTAKGRGIFHDLVAFRNFAAYMGWSQLVEKYDTRQTKKATEKDFLRPEELDYILKIARHEKIMRDGDLNVALRIAAVAGPREGIQKGELGGGIVNLRWEKIDWRARTIDIYESKTGGGFYWLGCPLDLFNNLAWNDLVAYWEAQGRPTNGPIFDFNYKQYRKMFENIAKRAGIKRHIKPHIMRKTHATMCGDADIPMEIVAGDAPYGYAGVGWEDMATLKKIYLSISKVRLAKYLEQARRHDPLKVEALNLGVEQSTPQSAGTQA